GAGAAGPRAAAAAGARAAGAPAARTAPAAATAAPTKVAAKLGGQFRIQYGSSDAPHLDIHQSNSRAVISYGVNMAYSQLLTYKYGPGTPIPNFSVTTDLAESFDQPDERTYVFKLRGGVKYQNLPPVNGRELVADDVIKSFERQVAEKANAAALAGVTRVEAPDKQTLKITLDTPNADFLWSLA